MLIKFLLPLICFSITSLVCSSQNNKSNALKTPSFNNRFYTVDEEQVKEIYTNNLSNKYDFLNGKEYKLYHVNIETSPLFDASFGMEGTVSVNGETYSDLMLAYDIFKDEVIFVSEIFKDHSFICINKSIVDSFTITRKSKSRINNYTFNDKNFHFEKVTFPKNTNIEMNDGYYETFRHKEMEIFIHHEAILSNNQGEEAIINGIFRYDYFQKRTLYKNGKYYDINSKRKFVKLFPENRKAINKSLRSYSVRFNLLSKEQLLEILQITDPN